MSIKSAPIPELTAVQEALSRARTDDSEGFEKLSSSRTWEVYTDGSAPIKNPGGAIGFSAVFVLSKARAWEVYGGTPGRTSTPATSNNRAEIAGVLSILELIHLLQAEDSGLPESMSIVCDSQYVVNCAQGKWKKHKNKDLWKRFDQLMCVARREKVKINFRWTRAHVGTKWNERADVLAKDGAFLAIGKKPEATSDQGESNDKSQDCHYLLQLYSEMTGRKGARGVYRLSTGEKQRSSEFEFDDVVTLDEAEYQLLSHGLDDLIETLKEAKRDPSTFRIMVDSSREIMIKQLQGLYGVKSERLQPLHKDTSKKSQQFEETVWLKSPKNELKDALKSW